MIDLAALDRTCAELREQPAADASGEGPRTVVGLAFLEQVRAELAEGRAAQARLGNVFGRPHGTSL